MTHKTGTCLAGVLLALGALPAAAQTADLCGGAGASGVWVGGSAETSDISTSDGPLDLSAITIPPSGTAVFLFTASTAGQYRIEALPATNGDTVIDILDQNGTVVMTDDDGGGDLASRAETALQPGTYCVSTRGFGGISTTADIRVARMEHDAITSGWDGGSGEFSGVDACLPSTPATTLGAGLIDEMLGSGVTATNSIAGTPYYRFTMNSPQPVSIRAENPSADPYIYIYDGSGILIAENDDFDGLNSRIDFVRPLAAGEYCIAMRSLSDANQPVTVSVSGYDPMAAMQDMYATGETSPPLNGSYPITDLGQLTTSLVTDQVINRDAVWFSFSVPAAGLAVIDAIGMNNSDPIIRLFDSVGRMIDVNDDAGGSLNSQLTVQVNLGTYVLGVAQYSEGHSGVVRIAIERYVPAQ